jgi:hypothetical protein
MTALLPQSPSAMGRLCKILQQALRLNLVHSFSRDTHDQKHLLAEMSAIWTVLQSLGVKYSSITRGSGVSEKILSQHVRFVEESLSNTQANCVDGSVLMASIFTKLGWGHSFLISIPGHCYFGVNLEPKNHKTLCVETTLIGNKVDFQTANRKGDEQFARDLPHLEAKEAGYNLIDIDECRRKGIQPLRQPQGLNTPINFGTVP